MRIKDCTTYYCYIYETNVYIIKLYLLWPWKIFFWLRQRKRLQNTEFKEIRNCPKTVLRSLAVLSVHTISPGCVRHMRAELRMDFSVACAILFGDFAVLENRILDNLSEVSTKFCCSISKFWKGRHHFEHCKNYHSRSPCCPSCPPRWWSGSSPCRRSPSSANQRWVSALSTNHRSPCSAPSWPSCPAPPRPAPCSGSDPPPPAGTRAGT